MPSADRLWVPLISHYRSESGTVSLDRERMAAHVLQLKPHVRNFLLAGSTGDGWEMGDDVVQQLVEFGFTEASEGTTLMFGALGQTTDQVIARAKLIESCAKRSTAPGITYAGLAVCPQVSADAGQDEILAHFEAIIAATRSPISVYELPQVTGCSMNPETVQRLADSPRVIMCKDTSGADHIARAKPDGVLMVRGAEGAYFEALAELNYDGLTLSSGNNFSATLERIITCFDAGNSGEGASLSEILTKVIDALFSVAGELPFGNPFSNANKGVDHLLAFGPNWRQHELPLTMSGERLPESFVAALDHRCLGLAGRAAGYLEQSHARGAPS